jgi:hypothetical protein
MRLCQGDNHLISARDGLAISDYLAGNVLKVGTPYRGIIFDLRRGPPVFGPKTRETLAGFFSAAAQAGIGVAVLVGESAIQVLQFRNLCRDAGGRADVFDSESDAIRWFARLTPSNPFGTR